jgi:hypothetical protein
MADHQSLNFPIRPSAPMSADKKCPANLNFALLNVVSVVAAGTDDRVCCAFNESDGAFACYRAFEELPENRLLIPRATDGIRPASLLAHQPLILALRAASRFRGSFLFPDVFTEARLQVFGRRWIGSIHAT